MAINAGKLLPSSKSNAIVSRESARKISVSNNYSFREDSQLLNQKKNRPSQWMIIKKQVIKIENFVKRKYVEDVKKQKEEDRLAEQSKRKKREEKLEDKPKADEKLPNIPSLPKLGFLDGIKKFIVNMILGFIAFRLIEHLPKIANFLKILAPAVDFFIDFSGKLLDGLVTFIDWGYKAYDFTRKQLKSFGGENFVKIFDTFNGAVGKVIEAAIITAIVLGNQGGGGGLGGDGQRGGLFETRRAKRGISRVTTTGGRNYRNDRTTGNIRASGSALSDARIEKLAQVGRLTFDGKSATDMAYQQRKGYSDVMKKYADKFGRDAAVRRFGEESVSSLGGKYARSGITRFGRRAFVDLAGKGGAKTVLGAVRPLLKRLPIIGALIDFGLSVALGEDPGRAAFKAIGAGLLGSVGAAVGSVVPIAGNLIGGIVGGIAGDAIGGALYDMFFGGKTPQSKGKVKGKVEGKFGGGITRGGKTQGSVKRKVKKPTTKRSITTEPTKLNPGKDAGGLKDIQRVFPKSTNLDTVNPLGYLEESYNKTSKIPFFGSLFGIATKTILGEKPNSLDYKNAGVGLNSWINNTFSGEVLRTGGAFAGGGEVNAEMFMKGEDLTNVIAKSVEESVSKRADEVLKNLQMQLSLKEIDRGKEPGEDGGATDEPSGSPTLTGNTNAEKVFRYLVDKEGFTPEAAAGVIGNLMQESGVNPKSRQLGGGPGRGIMQWTETERWASLSAWAKNSGKDPWALETQVEWMVKEMKDYGTYNRIKGVTSYKKAVEIFEREMERAGIPNYPRRYKFAADALASFSGGAGGPGIALGSGYGSAGSKISGELGRFIKSRLQSPAQFQAVTEHPEHGGVRGTHASGSYHYSGRALDIGAYTREQGPILNVIAEFNRMKGVKPVELITGRTDPAGHSDHVHVAYSKGGLVDGVTYAMMGERGREFVFDSNTTETVKAALPGFLESLNSTSNVSSVLKVIQAYASYDNAAPQEILIDDDQPSMMDYQSQGMNDQSFMMQISQSGGGSDPFQILDRLPG